MDLHRWLDAGLDAITDWQDGCGPVEQHESLQGSDEQMAAVFGEFTGRLRDNYPFFHPAYAGVSLALLHGSQPDVVVVCHQPGRIWVLGNPGFRVPSLKQTMDMNLRAGRLTNPAIRCGGVSLNTAHLSKADDHAVIAEAEKRLGLPAADPIRGGDAFDRLVDSCLGLPR